MRLFEEAFQSRAIDYQLTAIAQNQMPSLELNQMFGDSRPRGTDEFSKVPMPGRQSEPHALWIGSAEIFTQFQKNQRQALFQSAAHEICAAELNQIPAAKVAPRHLFKVGRRNAERYFD